MDRTPTTNTARATLTAILLTLTIFAAETARPLNLTTTRPATVTNTERS